MHRDRRRSRRVTPTQETAITIRAGESGRVLDISPLGALVEIGFPMPPRKRCALTVELAGRYLELKAEVRRCRAVSLRNGGCLTYQAALEFSPEDRPELEDWFVEQSLSEHSDTAPAGRTVVRVAEPGR